MWSTSSRFFGHKGAWISSNFLLFFYTQGNEIKNVFNELFSPYSPVLTTEGSLPDQDKWATVFRGNPNYVFRGDPRYPELFKKFINTPTSLKHCLQPTLSKVGIRDDLFIYERNEHSIAAEAVGTNSYKKRAPFITIPRGFFDIDQEACAFICKHEIGHIKNDDSINRSALVIISHAAAIGFSYYRSFWLHPSAFFSMATSLTCGVLYSQYKERRADNFAIQSSTDGELLGGLRSFKFFKIREDEDMKTTCFFENPIGYILVAARLTHPSPASRIEKVERALAQRKVVVDPAIENPKLEKLFEYEASLKKDFLEKYGNREERLANGTSKD